MKPVFFIFSLLFATWLVIEIEKIRPSDFGKYASHVSPEPTDLENIMDRKQYLKNLCSDYKNGILDSIGLDRQLTVFLKLPEIISSK